MTRLFSSIKLGVLYTLVVLLSVVLIYTTFELVFITIRSIYNHALLLIQLPTGEKVGPEHLMIVSVQRALGTVLVLLVIIELAEAIIEYIHSEKAQYVVVIYEIALISLVRHLVALDIEHAKAPVLWGLAGLIFVVGLFYFAFKFKWVDKMLHPRAES